MRNAERKKAQMQKRVPLESGIRIMLSILLASHSHLGRYSKYQTIVFFSVVKRYRQLPPVIRYPLLLLFIFTVAFRDKATRLNALSTLSFTWK